MSRSNPEGAGPNPLDRDELFQSQAPTVTSQGTKIASSTDTRPSHALPPGLFHRAAMRRSQSQQSHTPGEPTLNPEIAGQLDRINRSLHLYEDDLAQSINEEYLAFQSLPPQIQHLVYELGKVKREIMTGARYIGTALEHIDTSMV